MSDLFIDVDDTLILFKDTSNRHPYGLDEGGWRPNERLIAGIRDYHRLDPSAAIYIWSGGGVGYARRAASKLLRGVHWNAEGKSHYSFRLLRPDSIVVDDWKELFAGFAVKVYGPLEWPEA